MDIIAKLKRANKLLMAIEFDTKEAYDAYMKEHPNADPKNHSVVNLSNDTIKSFDEYVTNKIICEENINKVVKDLGYDTIESLDKYFLKMSNHPNSKVRSFVASFCKDPDIIRSLSNDKDYRVREFIGANRNTPLDILEKLSNDKNKYVVMRVAGNSKTPVDTLEKLSKNKNKYIRGFVARNSNTTFNILNKLTQDSSNVVLYGLLENDNLCQDQFNKIVKTFINNNSDQTHSYAVATMIALSDNMNVDTFNLIVNSKSKSNNLKLIKLSLAYKIENDSKNWHIDFSKMSPKLREIFKDLSPEEQLAFLIWLKNKNVN